jgi:hypothetical protein
MIYAFDISITRYHSHTISRILWYLSLCHGTCAAGWRGLGVPGARCSTGSSHAIANLCDPASACVPVCDTHITHICIEICVCISGSYIAHVYAQSICHMHIAVFDCIWLHVYVSWLLAAVFCAHEPVSSEHTGTCAWSYIHICIACWQCICVCMWMYFCPEYMHMCIPERSEYLYVSDCISRSHTCTHAFLCGCSAVA